MNPSMLPDLPAALQTYFGFSAFREGQEEIVRRAVEGHDTLAVMPTGSGKSLCYQLAAMLRPTSTIVISPLIALMKDQIDNLPPDVKAHASLINSSLAPEEAALRLRKLASGHYKLLYAAPERLRQRSFVSALKQVGVGLVVIDEVHCVSMWGHDFRPDYLFIRSALDVLGNPAILGLTATASAETAEDISRSLGRNLEVVRSRVDRPNLHYEVERVENEEARLRSALTRSKSLKGSGIIYARSREKCEILANLLSRNGVQALHYHAGLDSAERTRVQESFLRGESRVIVATTAFGMGIDKPDIRWILLYNFPNSLESYVQMIGRAGRDGKPGACVLLASRADATNLRRFAKADLPSVEQLRSIYRQLRDRAHEGFAELFREEMATDDDTDPRVLVGMLERVELVRRDFDSRGAMRVELLPPATNTAQRIETILKHYEDQALKRADRMVAFASSRQCRHLQVARHFGETLDVPCGMCDVCSPNHATREEVPMGEQRQLPENIAGTILDAVEGLAWPLGIKGLAAMLRGSVAAPPSAQRNHAFGVLSAAKEGTVKRWIGELLGSGNLETFESEDGYRLLRIRSKAAPPRLLPSGSSARSGNSSVATSEEPSESDAALFEALRAWRFERAQEANVPAYVVMHDQVLRDVAATRPANERDLLHISGIGPSKVEQHGEDILRIVRESDTVHE